MIKKFKAFFDLTKPTIMLLVIVTGGTALVLEGSLLQEPFRFLLAIVAIYLTGGSANALNQCFERSIDAKMKRTAARRPLPTNKISYNGAIIFSILIGLVGLLIFGLFFNWYSALLSLSTILFYSLFYTLYLKPNTSQNIVIGGAAGSMAPVGAWVAASGSMAVDPWILFLIIFLWTPPHFWALALVYKDDYRVAKLPMLPVIKGDDSTFRQIIIYSWLLVISSLLILINESLGIIYIVTAVILGTLFLLKSFKAKKHRTEKEIKGLFGYSIIYLFLLFMVIVIDGVI
jgi:protoheme IX farnesyltransferase